MDHPKSISRRRILQAGTAGIVGAALPAAGQSADQAARPKVPADPTKVQGPLASDVGGQAELIRHDVTGLLFPADSRESLVAGAARLGADPVTRARLGLEARRFVLAERSWTQVVSRYLPLYGIRG